MFNEYAEFLHIWGTCLFCADLQILDKFSTSGSSKTSEKLAELLAESETSPALQERLKVAFAEGYLASDKKKTDPEAKWNMLPRRLLRAVLTIAAVWLLFQLLQTYSALGGSMLSVLYSHQSHVNVLSILNTLSKACWGQWQRVHKNRLSTNLET